MKYNCNHCNHIWTSDEFDEDEDYESWAGTNCPECKSTDVSGED